MRNLGKEEEMAKATEASQIPTDAMLVEMNTTGHQDETRVMTDKVRMEEEGDKEMFEEMDGEKYDEVHLLASNLISLGSR